MKGHFVFWKRVDARREGAVEADDSEARRAHAFLRSLQGYEVTPLLRHSGLAAALDVAEVLWKDEGRRWRVGSFKALGAAYATSRLARDGSNASRTVCCATDGNHGRAVAWAARRLGYHAMVYLPEHATAARERRIRAFGATVVRVPGTYDDAVSEASRAAAEHDWVLVSDTAGDTSDSRGSLVIAAYTLIVQEIADTLQRSPQPTHVFVQAGVGGLAAAMTWWCRQVWPDVPPTIVVVEPLQAACVGVSLAKGRPVPVEGPLQTVADCLSAGKVSEVAWPILRSGVDAVVAVADDEILRTVQLASAGAFGFPPIEAGPSGLTGLTGALVVCESEDLRGECGIASTSRILLVGTEEPIEDA